MWEVDMSRTRIRYERESRTYDTITYSHVVTWL